MILIGPAVLIAVLMAFAVPHLWRMQWVPEPSHKAASPAPRAQER